MRATITAIGATMLMLALAGCEYFPPDPVGFRLVDGDLVVVPCESIEATGITMDVTDKNETTRFYEVRGAVSVSIGDEFSTAPTAAAPPGTSIRFTPELKPGSEIFVQFFGPGDSIEGFFTIGEAGIPSDEWLLADGRTSEWPCGYKR